MKQAWFFDIDIKKITKNYYNFKLIIMKETLALGFFKEEDLRRGEVYWNGKYYADINHLNDTAELMSIKFDDAIAYYVGKNNSDEKCRQIYIDYIFANDQMLKIKYVTGNELKYDSGFMQSALRTLIPKEKLQGAFIPLCVKIDKEAFDRMTDDETLLHKIKILKKKNDWQAIYNLIGEVENVKKKELLWNNAVLLDGLSFAAAKLSETYINIKRSFKTETERNDFLLKQKKYREDTIELRKRCIELDPEKPSYYSNLGYSHYQFTRELLMPGGRRDGKIKDEADKAIDYIDKALSLDPQRVTDLYRKGLILSSILPQQILFGGKNLPGENAIKESKAKIKEGIECLKLVESARQILPVLEDKMTKRYEKDYIKSLYVMARAYEELAGDEWDMTQYLLPLKTENGKASLDTYKEERLGYLDKALECMEKCSAADNDDFKDKFPLPPVHLLCRYNGVIDGTYKLYSMGKYLFQKYLILTACDESYFPEAEMYRIDAEKYFKAALKFTPKPENAAMSKAYIAEKYARVLISKGEYEKAVQLLEKYVEKNVQYYIRYTYSAACTLSGKYSDAEKQTLNAMKNERSNFEMWLGYFLLYVKYLREGNIEEAEKRLKISEEISKKTGRKNAASLAMGQAYISYRKGNRQEAIKILRDAERLNPRRSGIRRKIKEWENEN